MSVGDETIAQRVHNWVWRSLVACLNGVQEAGSSNLLTQTTQKAENNEFSAFFFAFWRLRDGIPSTFCPPFHIFPRWTWPKCGQNCGRRTNG